jgi:UPF0716 protein FxsA
MNLLGRLALLFVVIPILELVLLIELGQVVGLLPTLALVVFTGVTGAWLARAEGIRVFFQFQKQLASGQIPGQAMLDGISVLVGGAFLLTPGVLTDLFGFSLLFPPSRRWLQRRLRNRLESGIKDGSIRVVTMGATSMGGFGFGGTAAPGVPPWDGRPQPTATSDGTPRRDSANEIVIEDE